MAGMSLDRAGLRRPAGRRSRRAASPALRERAGHGRSRAGSGPTSARRPARGSGCRPGRSAPTDRRAATARRRLRRRSPAGRRRRRRLLVQRLAELSAPGPPAAGPRGCVAESAATRAVLAPARRRRRGRRWRCCSPARPAPARSSPRASSTRGRRARADASCPINCAAIPNELIEGELFGYVRGAFSGAVARLRRPARGRRAAAPCSSTRSTTRRRRCRSSCCACSRTAWSPGSARTHARAGRLPARRGDQPRPRRARRGGRVRRRPLRAARDRAHRAAAAARAPRRPPASSSAHFIARFYREEPAASHRVARRHRPRRSPRSPRYPWPGNVRELRNVLFHALVAQARRRRAAALRPAAAAPRRPRGRRGAEWSTSRRSSGR